MSDPESGSPEPGTEKIHWDLEGGMDYGSYLSLESILGAQHPLSEHHDEMLFIIIHQVSELWLKLSLHELGAVRARLSADDLRPAFKMLSRVARIHEQMTLAWEVLSTLTPPDYLTFRGKLGKSSGFQSYQYRALEFTLGNRSREMIEVHRSRPAVYRRLQEILSCPSLYDECLRLLGRRGFSLPPECLERDWSLPYQPHAGVEKAWLQVYRDVERHWDLYELAEKLVDLEQKFQQWRFAHLRTVERIIGRKPGTGGSSGVDYLEGRLSQRCFPELWSVRTLI